MTENKKEIKENPREGHSTIFNDDKVAVERGTKQKLFSGSTGGKEVFEKNIKHEANTGKEVFEKKWADDKLSNEILTKNTYRESEGEWKKSNHVINR